MRAATAIQRTSSRCQRGRWSKTKFARNEVMGCSGNSPARKLMMKRNAADAPVVFNGKLTTAKLAKYGRRRLEDTVTRLVKFTSGLDAKKENYKKPMWWPREILFLQPLENLKKVTPDAAWNHVLRRLVALCTKFYAERGSNGKKIEVGKGRRCKQTALKEVQQNPVVCLQNIFKNNDNRDVNKSEFVEGLNLVPVGGLKQASQPAVLKPVRLVLLPNVPFSSDYARVLVKREKQVLPEEVHLKKLERLERYLKTDSSAHVPTEATYPVTFVEKKEFYCHIYQFPARQSYQIQDKVTFLKSLCKPVSVVLVRCDHLCRKAMKRKRMKVLKVVLPRLKIQATKKYVNN